MSRSNQGGCGSPLWNFATLNFLGLTVVFFIWFIMLAMNPNATLAGMNLNPFPPNDTVVNVAPTYTLVAPAVMPTFQASDTPQPTSAIELPPTFTAEAGTTTEAPDTSGTATNTQVPLATQTQFQFGATNTPGVSFDELWFSVIPGLPGYQDYETCDSMWVGGAVFDPSGAPYTNLYISLTGMFGEEGTYAGTAQHRGDSGYEIQLTSDGPKAGSIFLQLFDGDTFDEVSELTVITTKSSCDENYIQVDWVQSAKP